ncbi:MAG: rhomboid family intramembrane serine protease [Gemmatimonadetes bacterium]|nr:rhomboid family intramembrane serine protease [Gemmatimonadota bacterium]
MTTWVRRLLIANVMVFFVQFMAPDLIGPVGDQQPANPFVFVPRAVLFRPWSIVTYMFLHASITHILFNMIGLFFFGPQVESRIGARRFVQLYFISGISGALFQFIFSPRSAVIGASAGVFGVMLAFAIFWPRVQIMIWGIIPIQARWLVVITTALALYSGFGGSRGGVADFAHLGGYAGAYLFLKMIDPARRVAKFRASTIAKPDKDKLANWKRVDVAAVHEVNRDELNRILDKISATGLTSLSAEERLFLSNFVPPDDRPAVS